MIEAFYSWIKAIVVYLILISLVMNLLPDSHYKKYVRLFSGMILITLVIAPLGKLAGQEGAMGDFFAAERYRQELQEFQTDIRLVREFQEEAAMAAYQAEIRKQIEAVAKKEGVAVGAVRARFGEDLVPEEIEMEIESEPAAARSAKGAQGALDEKAGKIRRELAQLYQVAEEQVRVAVNEGE